MRDSFFDHFCKMTFVSLNGLHLPSNQPLIQADNRGFKYGDGFFETIKFVNGSIELMQYHFDRIIKSADILKIGIGKLEKQLLTKDILELCIKNDCIQTARIRVALYRNEKNEADYLIEALPYMKNKKSEGAFSIDLYSDIQKPIDILSNLKTANYLPYIMASMNAHSISVDDCLIRNTKGFICDSSKANVFIIKNGNIYTPALTEGCVDGTMRRFVINKAKKHNIQIIETEISFDQILDADEVFLTNALMGIQPVIKCRDRIYSDYITQHLCKKIFQPFKELIVD